MSVVLDTGVLIAGRPAGLSEAVGVSAVSIAELRYGALVATDPVEVGRRLTRLAAIEAEFDPLPVDAAVATSYGHLAAIVHRTGRRPRARALDLLIAATAHAAGAGLVTRNPRDLAGLDGELRIVGV